jgi:glutathionyl-hydroquinone reductase
VDNRQEGLLVPTLADWLLFTHLIRFDAVESILFKANLRRIQDYQHLQVRRGMVCPQWCSKAMWLCAQQAFLHNDELLRAFPLQGWLADLCAMPGVTETLKWQHIMAGGWLSRPDLNPKSRIPRG